MWRFAGIYDPQSNATLSMLMHVTQVTAVGIYRVPNPYIQMHYQLCAFWVFFSYQVGTHAFKSNYSVIVNVFFSVLTRL